MSQTVLSTDMEEGEGAMGIEEIRRVLPHTYPLLLVDRVLEYKIGEYIRAVKCVTANEPFFPGHFSHRMLMPGALVIEALSQAAGILGILTAQSRDGHEEHDGHRSVVMMTGFDLVRFRRQITPGDKILLNCQMVKAKAIRNMYHGQFEAKGIVDGKVAVSAKLSAVSLVEPV